MRWQASMRLQASKIETASNKLLVCDTLAMCVSSSIRDCCRAVACHGIGDVAVALATTVWQHKPCFPLAQQEHNPELRKSRHKSDPSLHFSCAHTCTWP